MGSGEGMAGGHDGKPERQGARRWGTRADRHRPGDRPRREPRAWATASLASGLVLAGTLAGCSTSGPEAGAAATASPSSPSAVASVSPSAVPTRTSASPGVPTCRTSVLSVKIEQQEGTAGTHYFDMWLRNNSSARCAVRGYPGVSFIDAAGKQVGAAADRDPLSMPPDAVSASGATVVLAKGGVALFAIGVVDPGALPGCDQSTMAKSLTWRIYPPDNTVALLVVLPPSMEACDNPSVHQLKVTTVGAV